METGAGLSAAEYLDRLFDVIREEARANPEFAARLVKATGGQIVFDAADRVALINPVELAARGGEPAVREAAVSLSEGDLRKILKAHGLATPVDVRARTRDELTEMMAQRAAERAKSRSS